MKSEDVLCDPAWRLQEDTVDQLIKEIYGDLEDVRVSSDKKKLLERCILASTNEQCNIVNDRCMELFHVSLASVQASNHPKEKLISNSLSPYSFCRLSTTYH